MPPKVVQPFRAPTAYEEEMLRAKRQQQLAEMLRQQAFAPEEEPFTFQGFRAMPSAAGALSKMLQAYGAKKVGEKAEESERRAREADIAGAEALRRELAPQARVAAPTTAEIAGGIGMPQISEEGTVSYGPSVQAPTRTEMVGPTAAERRNIFANYAVTGTPTAQRLAQVMAGMETPEEAEYGTTPQYDKQGRAFVVNKAGNVRYLDGVTAPPKTTTLQDDFKFAQSQGYRGTFEQFRESNRPQTNVYSTTAVAGVDANGNPVFFQTSPTGGAPMVVPGVRPKPEAPGVEESKSALFADRMAESAPLLDILPPPSITASAKGKTPLVGNVLLSPENKQFNQAALNFISAVLRKESGANIPDTEIESQAKIYIPMAGDDPTTREQKRRARESAIRGLALSAGPSYKPVPINPPEGVTPQEWAVMTLDERRKFAR